MPPFRQAPHDPEKAAMSGVKNYIPQRSQPDLSHDCKDCERTATYEIIADGEKFHACDSHRREYAVSSIKQVINFSYE